MTRANANPSTSEILWDSFKRALARQVLPEDQRVYLVSALVSVHGFQVAHMPHNRILTRDSIRA